MKHFFKSAALVLILTLVIVQLPQILRQVQEWRYPRCYAAEVEGWAAAYDLDPLLIYSFIHTESSFDPKAESSVGARGLMQMTEETFYWIKSKIAPDEALNFDSLYDPDCSIRFGAYYLKLCLERYGGDIATARRPITAAGAPWMPCWKMGSTPGTAPSWPSFLTPRWPTMSRKFWNVINAIQSFTALE